jgi:peptide/nickel transport system ATP-binding protein
METVVEVDDLTVAYRHGRGFDTVVHHVSFKISRGEVLGLVGESGCGKSTVGLQLLGFRPPQAKIQSGRVLFKGTDVLTLSRHSLDRLRGDRIGFVPQNPTTALNPGMRVGDQLAETLTLHARADGKATARVRTIELFDLVGLPKPTDLLSRYPHQLSGGQQQRVCIANALACDPDLVVLDEPTTGLDVTTQEQIITLLVSLRARLGMAMLYVTHDLGLLAQIADRVGVMYAGHLVETAPSHVLFAAPRHPYTRGLIASVPRIEAPDSNAGQPLRGMLRRSELPPGCAFAPRCDHAEAACRDSPQQLEGIGDGHEIACRRWRQISAEALIQEPAEAGRRQATASKSLLEVKGLSLDYGGSDHLLGRIFPSKRFRAVEDVSFAIETGETFALVGESGSGKSTIARGVSGLIKPAAGAIRLHGAPLAGLVRERSAADRRRIQYIFQNPDASLNPRTKVKTILARPLEMLGELDGRTIRERVAKTLADVRLDSAYGDRYPDELSGGERQRVAIARALIMEPDLVLCDEVLSALDVSVQASILDLLRRLKREKRLTMLFISHDLAVVRSIADRVGVLFRGRLMEVGPSSAVFRPPYHPYTMSLINAVPRIDAAGKSPKRTVAKTPSEPIPGAACAYAGRCAVQLGELCVRTTPPWQRSDRDVGIGCHRSLDDLAAPSTIRDASIETAH